MGGPWLWGVPGGGVVQGRIWHPLARPVQSSQSCFPLEMFCPCGSHLLFRRFVPCHWGCALHVPPPPAHGAAGQVVGPAGSCQAGGDLALQSGALQRWHLPSRGPCVWHSNGQHARPPRQRTACLLGERGLLVPPGATPEAFGRGGRGCVPCDRQGLVGRVWSRCLSRCLGLELFLLGLRT